MGPTMVYPRKGATEFLGLLLGIDLFFILLHLFHLYTPYFQDPAYSIEMDRGFAETFQYIQGFWLVLLFCWLTAISSPAYLTWALLFAYIVVDDAFMLHERIGRTLAGYVPYQDVGLLRTRDIGELVVFATIGALFLLLFGAAYYWSGTLIRNTYRQLLRYFALLVFFGVVVDLLHIMVGNATVAASLLGLLEDGGEMVALSLLCWYSFQLLQQTRLDSTMQYSYFHAH